MPGHGTRLLLVSPEHLHLLTEIPDVKQFQQVISAGSHQPVTVFVPLQVHNGGLVGVPVKEGIDNTGHNKPIGVTYNVASACPLLGSQSLIGCWLSLLPDTMRPFCGCQWTHLTSAP